MTISLTEREIELVLSACGQYIELMENGEDTHEYTIYELDTGLGSALRKLSKGRYSQRVYAGYKTVTKYPTFDEWKAGRGESEEMNGYMHKTHEHKVFR